MLAKVIIENGVKKIQALTADTGTGAPVGSIIVVCSNILPSGYLGLGVQYDITNYPALYQVLGTDTTPTASALGLPILSSGQYAIKATSGLTENQQENVLNTINENNSYSTEEHPTGKKWIDGKDIYRKVVLATGTETFTPTGQDTISGWSVRPTNLDKIVSYQTLGIDNLYNAIILRNNPNESYITFRSIGVNITVNVGDILIIEYTKTTD